MKGSSAISIPCDGEMDFYIKCLSFMKPLYPVSKLPFKQIETLAAILCKRRELTKLVKDENMIPRLLFSTEVKNAVMKLAKLSKSHYYLTISNLKKLDIIKENGDLDKRVIFDIENNKFSLLISFQIRN
jgi:hypothetical protein